MTYARPGRPTNAQRTARAWLDRFEIIRGERIQAQADKEAEAIRFLAALDGRDQWDLDDFFAVVEHPTNVAARRHAARGYL